MDIKKVFVVGAGFMGSGIVEDVAVKGLAVTAYDISQNQLDKSIAGIRKNLEKSVSKGKLSEDEKEAAIGRISCTCLLYTSDAADE